MVANGTGAFQPETATAAMHHIMMPPRLQYPGEVSGWQYLISEVCMRARIGGIRLLNTHNYYLSLSLTAKFFPQTRLLCDIRKFRTN